MLRRIELIDGPSVASGDEVAIDVHGDFYAGMAQLFLHIDRIFALAQQQAGVGMPDVMKPHFPNAGFAQHSFEDAANVVLLHWFAISMENIWNRLAQPSLQRLPFAFGQQLAQGHR
ncbi:MAG: hypothetical protein PVH26_08800 [Desulfosarcina sp.]